MASSELPLDELTKSQVGVLCQVALLTSVWYAPPPLIFVVVFRIDLYINSCCAGTVFFTRLFATASARYKTEENVAVRRVVSSPYRIVDVAAD